MSDEEKAKKFDEISAHLWNMALYGNLMQSTVAASLIRSLQILGPNGESPDDA